MGSTPQDIARHRFESFDGTQISYLSAGPGDGVPVLLVHGFVSDAQINWVKGGTVAQLAENGFRVIAPDLRGHGQSAKPHGDDAYPDDVLAMDQEALLDDLKIASYHLVGYSLGAITAGRMLVRGAAPLSLTLSGMGESITDGNARRDQFVAALSGKAPAGDPFAQMVTGFVKRTGGDATALAQVMRGRKAVSSEDMRQWALPCLVLNGEDDNDNGSGEALAAMIQGARCQTIPGNHMDVIFKPDFAAAIVEFVTSS